MTRRWLHHTLALSLAFLWQCDSGEAPVENQGNLEAVGDFDGVENVTPNPDGTWTIWWNPIISATDVYYAVFQRSATEAFDFDNPIATTKENKATSDDLRLVGNTCFLVRFVQSASEDSNDKEICTEHESFLFKGLESLSSLDDGRYILKWKDPKFVGGIFNIYRREIPASPAQTKDEGSSLANTMASTVDPTESRLIASVSEGLYVTDAISLDERFCYSVRYVLAGLANDDNKTELCTRSDGEHLALQFPGISDLENPETGVLKASWKPLDHADIVGYNIYLGYDFRELVGHAAGKETKEFTVSDLFHGVEYTVGVRAVDKFGREDTTT